VQAAAQNPGSVTVIWASAVFYHRARLWARPDLPQRSTRHVPESRLIQDVCPHRLGIRNMLDDQHGKYQCCRSSHSRQTHRDLQ